MLTRLFFRGARLLHVSLGLRNPVANDVGDRPTLGSDLGSCNWAVGRLSGLLGMQFGLGFLCSRNKTGRYGVSEEIGGRVWGYFVAQREKLPRHSRRRPTCFSDAQLVCSSCRGCVRLRSTRQSGNVFIQAGGFTGIARTSSSDAASRCSTAATGDEVFWGDAERPGGG